MQRDYFSQMQANQTGTPTPNEISTGPGQPQGMMPDVTLDEVGEEQLSTAEQKERIVAMLTDADILNESNEKQIMAEVDKMLAALEAGDIEAFQQNPVTQLIGSIVGSAAEMSQMNEGQGPTEQQMMQMEQEADQADQAQQPDMASMAGMAGGQF
jgi:hypothetical protein